MPEATGSQERGMEWSHTPTSSITDLVDLDDEILDLRVDAEIIKIWEILGQGVQPSERTNLAHILILDISTQYCETMFVV